MSTRPDSSDSLALELLYALTDRLKQVSQPVADIQVFLDQALTALCDQWPGIERAEIYLRDEQGEVVRHAGVGVFSGAPTIPAPGSPAVLALETGQPVTPEPESGLVEWAIPLVTRAASEGALCVTWPDGKAISLEMESLTTFALSLSVAVEHLRVLLNRQRVLQDEISTALTQAANAIQQRATYADALGSITSRLQQQTDVHIMLQQTMQDLGSVLGARRARVRLQVVPTTGKLESES